MNETLQKIYLIEVSIDGQEFRPYTAVTDSYTKRPFSTQKMAFERLKFFSSLHEEEDWKFRVVEYKFSHVVAKDETE